MNGRGPALANGASRCPGGLLIQSREDSIPPGSIDVKEAYDRTQVLSSSPLSLQRLFLPKAAVLGVRLPRLAPQPERHIAARRKPSGNRAQPPVPSGPEGEPLQTPTGGMAPESEGPSCSTAGPGTCPAQPSDSADTSRAWRQSRLPVIAEPREALFGRDQRGRSLERIAEQQTAVRPLARARP